MNQKPIHWSIGAAIVITLASSSFLASPAFAADTPTGDGGGISLYVKGQDGTLQPISQDVIDASLMDLKPPAPPTSKLASPQYIDWNEWYGCFVLNHSEDVYQLFTFYWDGVGKDIRMKCGTNGWGYKHISNDHAADWQAKWDAAVDAGWIPDSQGMDSWDDLMAVGTGEAITYPEDVGGSVSNNTTCAVTELWFIKQDSGLPMYHFRLRAVWANDSDRLITSFPQSGISC